MSDDPKLRIATEDLCDTESEKLFVRLCQREGFLCHRVSESNKKGSKRPDFLVPNVAYFEVKEVEATEEEIAAGRAGEIRRMTMTERWATFGSAIDKAGLSGILCKAIWIADGSILTERKIRWQYAKNFWMN